MKNVIFDLAGVVFSRDRDKTPKEILEYFSFINSGEIMPQFWQNYDLGANAHEVAAALAQLRNDTPSHAFYMMMQAIEYQREVLPTKELIQRLKQRGFSLYVLSNMSREYIDFLRKFPVYALFDGEVVSCEVHLAKPSSEIFETILTKYSLKREESIFIDDRVENVNAAINVGIHGFLFDRNNPRDSASELTTMLLG
ncbi:MAG: HAD family phosphatase [Alistipes sp.]|nr:HAD family phosphatase [Candidatus Alistipes equi]